MELDVFAYCCASLEFVYITKIWKWSDDNPVHELLYFVNMYTVILLTSAYSET